MMKIFYILIAIVILGFIVMMHELGHFIVGRLCGIGVLEFSIGFGPKIIGFRRKETDYPCAPFRWAATANLWAMMRRAQSPPTQ